MNTFDTIRVEKIKKAILDGENIPNEDKIWYLNNDGVRKAGLTFFRTEEEKQEYVNSSNSVEYFTDKAIALNPDFAEYKVDVLNIIDNGTHAGFIQLPVLHIIHHALFFKNSNFIIERSIADLSEVDTIEKIRQVYSALPFFMKEGVTTWNKNKASFENRSSIEIMTKSKFMKTFDGVSGVDMKPEQPTIDIPDGIIRIPFDFDWTADLSDYANKTLEVIFDYDLKGRDVVFPENVRLKPMGGRFLNGKNLIGSQTVIEYLFNLQVFDLSITLTGTWQNDTISPQYYGAITNANTGIAENCCSDAIQKCADSMFGIHYSWGFYYMTKNVYFRRQNKIMTCQPASIRYQTPTIQYVADHVRFYSSHDVNKPELDTLTFFTFQAKRVFLFGGIVDCSRNPYYNGKAIVFDCSGGVHTHYSQLTTKLVGSQDGLRAGTFGGVGIYTNQKDAMGYSESYSLVIDTVVSYFGIGIWFTGRNPLNTGTTSSFNSLSLTASFYGNKQEAIIKDAENSTINFGCQCDSVNTQQEFEDLVAVDVSNSNGVFNCSYVDYHNVKVLKDNNGNETGRYYGNKQIVISRGTNVTSTLTNNSVVKLINKHKTVKNSYLDDVIVPANKSFGGYISHIKGSAYISQLHNALAYFTKTLSGATVTAYDGSGVEDFDLMTTTSAEAGIPTTDNLLLLNKDNLSGYSGVTPQMRFLNEETRNTDYLEFYLPNVGRYPLLYIALAQHKQLKRIQVISSDYRLEIKNIYPSSELSTDAIKVYDITPYFSYLSSCKVIIRLIGCTQTHTATTYAEEGIYIEDIGMQRLNSPMIPFIHSGGGQEIYGELTVKGGLIEPLLPIFENNAQARQARLGINKSYRTSEGVKMVVF